MIGTFWNLCRACPSMPVDKLHSEYRSTYRWHEYTGPRQEIIRRPPQPINATTAGGNTGCGGKWVAANPAQFRNEENKMKVETTSGFEPALPRRKKNPALAYKTHEFIVMSDGDGSNDSLDTSVPVDRARSEERGGSRNRGPSRRSKSEGPPGECSGFPGPILSEYHKRYGTGLGPRTHGWVTRRDSDPSKLGQDLLMIASYMPSAGTTQTSGGVLKNAISRISTEYRLQFNWPRGSAQDNATEDIKTHGGTGPPRKSLSMGAIKPTDHISSINNPLAPVHRKKFTDADRQGGGFELEPLVGSTADMLDDEVGEEKIREETWDKGDSAQLRAKFKTEYKKRFRPFSQYDYIEGRFKPKKEEMEPLQLHELPEGDSWYREVIELRKKAGEYKHRGWGTELVPERIAELYNKQMTLWEQVSRRSSLSALSLAATTPRSVSKEEKEKENNNKSSPTKLYSVRKQSPNRTVSMQNKKVEKTEENKKEPQRSRRDMIRHHLERTTGAGRSQSVGPEIPITSEKSSPKRSSRGPNPSKAQMNGPVTTERHSRPTTLSTSAPSRTKSSSGSVKVSDNSKHKYASANKNYDQLHKALTSDRSKKYVEENAGSAEEANKEEEPKSEPLIDMEPVIKSPPEPTRVKSPEQILMRSPEPVNWTVPLDTGKTFTVTQNVLEGEMIGRANSEAKAWTPPAAPLAPPKSAPPQLPETEGWTSSDQEIPDDTTKNLEDPIFRSLEGESEYPEEEKCPVSERPSSSASLLSKTIDEASISLDDPTSQTILEDPVESVETIRKSKILEGNFEPSNENETEDMLRKSSISSASSKSLATDVLDKARTRFDKFWGKGKESPENENVKSTL
uniref:Nuclear protein MDM1 n=2 Tax=Clastoptera arizonana TaxID=38151 RepID=A0A1B6DXR6_9HEMI